MSEQLSPGIAFSEPRVAPVDIQSASTSIGSMVGVAERGPSDDPVLCGSLPQAQSIFGELGYAGSPLLISAKAFFDNGGKSLYISRVLHYSDATDPTSYDAVAATVQLSGTGPANTALFAASSPGSHGNDLSLTTTRIDTQVTVGGALTVAAHTSYEVTDPRRLYVGAQVDIRDSVTPANHVRVVVTRINGKIIYFASATPSGAITIGNVFLEEEEIVVLRSGTFVERIRRLAWAATAGKLYFKEKINNNDPARQIVVETDDALAFSNTVDPRPLDDTYVVGTTTAGDDGTAPDDDDHIGAANADGGAGTGLYAFDKIDDMNLLAIPGRCSAAVHQAIITYLENRALPAQFGILSVNEETTPADAVEYVTVTANLYSEYVAIYYPWLQVSDALTGLLTTRSGEGDAMGVYARTDATRGVQKAPAGTPDGKLNNVLGPERVLTKADQDLLYPVGINMFISKKGKGTLVWGSRTLGVGSEFDQINVRRVFNFVKLSLDAGTQFLVFEENNDATRAKVRKTVGAFLLRMWRRGILKGATADEAFTIKCDRENNPASVENSGTLVCRIGLAVSRPAEFIEFELVQDTRAIDAELAAAGVR